MCRVSVQESSTSHSLFPHGHQSTNYLMILPNFLNFSRQTRLCNQTRNGFVCVRGHSSQWFACSSGSLGGAGQSNANKFPTLISDWHEYTVSLWPETVWCLLWDAAQRSVSRHVHPDDFMTAEQTSRWRRWTSRSSVSVRVTAAFYQRNSVITGKLPALTPASLLLNEYSFLCFLLLPSQHWTGLWNKNVFEDN